jgi:predicted kinase
MIQNFTQIFEILENNPKLNDEFENHGEIESLHILHRWTLNQLDALKIEFEKRKLKGYIRECHGDLHLGNITVINNAVSLFDCIEFNDSFRIIDVMSEIAFLLMDLEDRNAPAFASHFLNVYLSETGDYEGLTLLTIYKAFRSLVRAKVHLMTCVSAHSHELVLSCMKNCHKYIELASNYLDVPRLNLVLLCGLSGSGKSYWGSKISREVGLIHLKSDVERKRLHNIEALQDSIKSGINIYDSETSCRTYARLAEIAELLMTSGFSVLIDATFLKLRYRQIFYELCKSKKPLNPKISLVHLNAPLELLKKRIVLRQQNLRRDPSEATIEVLLNQIKSFEKFQDEDLTNSELIEVSVTDHGLDFTDRTSSRNNSNCSTGILDTILQAMQ